MSRHQDLVDEFMKKAGQELPDRPTVPPLSIRHLRAKLILEEAVETIKALGFAIRVTGLCDYGGMEQFEFSLAKRDKEGLGVELVERFQPDLVEIIDGCCDVRVVTTGTLSACGCIDDEFQEEVDQSNLRKFGPGGYKRDDGKWIKPPDWKKPDIQSIIDQGVKRAEFDWSECSGN